MIIKNRLITCLLCLISVVSLAQTSDPDQMHTKNANTETEKTTFLIQVEESSDDKKYFPKLYPIGYIVARTDEKERKTRYFLADFPDNQKANEVLKTVRSLGYTDAFIVESTL